MKQLFFSLFFTISFFSIAQSQESYGSWNTLLLDYQINDTFSIKNEVHVRRTNFLANWQQFLVRPSVNYNLNQHVAFAVGYTFADNYTPDYSFHEHNVWEQVILLHSSFKSSFKHRFRYEQRFVEEILPNPVEGFTRGDATFLMRLRYRFTWSIPLFNITETNTLRLSAFDEIWLNTDKGIVPKSLNQNWFFIGVSYPLFKNTSLAAGYLNIYAPTGNDTYATNHIMQTTIKYSIK